MPPRSQASAGRRRLPALFFLLLAATACSVRPDGAFQQAAAPTPPNYSLAAAWAAHPSTVDKADRSPDPEALPNRQAEAEADVFFLHPTTYTGKRGEDGWNGSIYDAALRRRTDDGPILYQASIFNGAGRIFAPRYRQAHLQAYFEQEDERSVRRAFDLAYSDVAAAFEYYLEHHNGGRPIIIAAHSQGATHAKRLLREYFDGQALQKQLVVAYLAGMPVAGDYFQFIKACGGPEEVGCFCSWRTWRRGRYPDDYEPENNIAVTNPLNWTTTDAYAPRSLNEGAVLKDFTKILPKVADAQVQDGVLWTQKPKFPGSFLLLRPNYHVGDYNLYYVNVRENAVRRVNAYRMLYLAQGDKTGD